MKSIAERFKRIKAAAVDRIAPVSLLEQDGLAYWRARILAAIIFTGLMMSLFALMPAVIYAIEDKLWELLIFDLAAWLIGVYLLVSKRLSYRARATTGMLLLYAVGCYIIASVGLLSGGPAWLFAFAVLVGVLLGARAAFLAVVLNAISLAGLGWLIGSGELGSGFLHFNSTAAMVAAGASFIFLNAITALSIAVLVKGMVASHQKEKALAAALERERSQLLESERKFRTLVENINDVIYSISGDGKILYISPAVERLMGYDPAELVGRNFSEFVHADDLPYLIEQFPKVLGGDLRPNEYRLATKAGHYRWVRSSSQPVQTGGQVSGLQGVLTDINEQKELKAQLQHSRKMEAIGTLSGGIAHEFNNILGIILGNIELTMDDIPSARPEYGFLVEVRSACLRGKEIVKQLLSFSRRAEQQKQLLDMGPVIKEAIHLMRASTPADILFDGAISQGCHPVMGDSTQIHQVVINLCTNAVHAMESGGGKLKVGLDNVVLEVREVFFDAKLDPGEYVRLSISDTGHGISPDAMDRIFDPFFTTKEVNKGTGMGLAVVLGIIKGHDGGIRLVSNPGEGTTVECYIPMAGSEPHEKVERVPSLNGGSERILLVDDEAALVKLERLQLERLGYRVCEHSHPEAALDDFRNDPNGFDLVITDMAMPQMTGDQLIRSMVAIRPDIKTILCTGWSGKLDAANAADTGAGAIIFKPIEKEIFARTIRAVLDGSPARRNFS